MRTGALRPTAVEPGTGAGPTVRPSRWDVGGAIGLVLLLAFLWGRGRGTWYWTDEGLSLGIASQPLEQFRDVLLQDTAAPL